MRNVGFLFAIGILLASSGCLQWVIPANDPKDPAPAQATPMPTPDPISDDAGDQTTTPPDDGGVTAPTDAATAFSLSIEAEQGTLTAPMAQQIDTNASGGEYIMVPAGGVGGKASFAVTVPHDGSYALWGRVLAATDLTNSFHLSVDADTIDNDASDGVSTIWDLTVTTTFAFQRANMRIDAAGTDKPLTLTLTAGAHTLYLNEREDQAQLDKLVLTDDLNATPQ
jgi:hypothetical protein